MPEISGNDKALMYSLAGVARAGAARVGYYPPRLFVRTTSPGVTEDFADVSQTVLKSDVELEQHLDGGNPDVLTLTVRSDTDAAFPVQPGAGIQLCLGTTAHPIFEGRVLSVQQSVRTASQRFPRWRIRAVDHSYVLNFVRPKPARYQMSATAAGYAFVEDNLTGEGITATAQGFTVHVENDLPDVDLTTSVTETISQFLTRLADAFGGAWFVDAQKKIHIYRTTPPATFTLDDTTKFRDLTYEDDISQVRNRVYVVGGGGVTTQAYAAGDPVPSEIHVDDVSWYTSLGGVLMINQHFFVHFGKTDGADPTLDSFAMANETVLPVAIPLGTPVRVVATTKNLDSIADVLTWFNQVTTGDDSGNIDHVIEDDRLDVDGALFRAQVEAALYAQSFTTISLKTRDPRFVAGDKVIAAIPNIASFVDVGEGGAGEFLVQDVTISGAVADRVFPERTVRLGSFRRDLSSLLARLGLVPTVPKGSQGI